MDLGTTFVAAARSHHDARIEMLTLGDRSVVMPSVVFVGEDGGLVTGEAAERRVASSPERVARQFKRRLGDPTPMRLGQTSLSAIELLAVLLREVLDRVARTEGEPPGQIVLTHPANWGSFRRGVFGEVPRAAGLCDVLTLTEPEAAAMHYAATRRLADGEVMAVYDLGGGTFDATVVRKVADGVATLGTPEGVERLGGIDFDQALFDFVNFSCDGALSELDMGNPKIVVALARLRQDCVLAKESLSVDTETLLPVFLPGQQFDVRITRAEFEDLIRAQIESTITALSRALRSAQVSAEELNAVLLVGGSSRIPLVAQMVSEELGRPILVDTHPKYAVALGAATPTHQPRTRAHTTPTPQPAATPATTPGTLGPRSLRSTLLRAAAAVATLAGVATLIWTLTPFSTPPTGTVVLLGTDQRSGDPFGPSLVVDGSITPTAQLDAAARHNVTGDQDGLYFDTTGTSSCNSKALDAALSNDRKLADAWRGAVVGTAVDAHGYLTTLTPARLRADTRVTAFSYTDGEAKPYPAVLQAGTAVLVDDFGLPKVDCADSDPLAAPSSISDPHYDGIAWTGFNPTDLTEIHPAATVVREFVLVNPAGAAPFRRPRGTDGTQDFAQLPNTGKLDSHYIFTGSMTHCDGYSACPQEAGRTFAMDATFSGCPTSCTMATTRIRTQENENRDTFNGHTSLARVGDDTWQATINSTATCSTQSANGTQYQGPVNGTGHLTVTVTNSAVVSGIWKATEAKVEYETSHPARAPCKALHRAFSLTGGAQ